MFELDAFDDLVLPRPHSTTGRALASMVRRRCFEQLKALAREGHPDPALGALVAELRESFAKRLPGDPHAISALVGDASVGIPLRRGLSAIGTRGSAADADALALGLRRLLAGLGDLAASEPAAQVHAIEGKVGLRVGDTALVRCLGVADTSTEVPSALVVPLRSALTLLGEVAPAMRADVDRLTSTVMISATGPTELPPWSFGLAVVPASTDPTELLVALVASSVVGKLHALVEGRPYDSARLSRLAREASSLASERVLEVAAARRLLVHRPRPLPLAEETCPPDDPLVHVVAELRTLANRAKLPT